MTPSITFLGAAGEVTGSAARIEAAGARFLVDCGMFQGGRDAGERNAQAFAGEAHGHDFAIVTHAHLDHCGLAPVLAGRHDRRLRGPLYATPATADLMAIMLRDSALVMEKNAAWRARHGEPGGAPLYGEPEVERTLDRVARRPYGETFSPHPGIRVRFSDAGHILGAAIVEIWIDGPRGERKLVVSGDLGQPARPLVRDPTPIDAADAVVVESTYGNRLHRGIEETTDELVATVHDVIEVRRGNLVVPAFALGRTQELLTLLIELTRAGRLRDLTVYVDSPLAREATRATVKHAALLDEEAYRALVDPGAGGLPIRLRFVESIEESKALNAIASGAILVAGSGMCDGGRIKHHLERNLGRPECGVLFTGYQAAGTLGRKIVDGLPSVRIFGVRTPVRATIHTLGGLSAHADRGALLGWLRHFDRPPQTAFVVHGEAAVAAEFAATVQTALGWPACVPERGATYPLFPNSENDADATVQSAG